MALARGEAVSPGGGWRGRLWPWSRLTRFPPERLPGQAVPPGLTRIDIPKLIAPMSGANHFDDTVARITDLVFVPSGDGAVDLALVLGAPNTTSADAALSLYRRGMVRRIMVTGHGPKPDAPPEWQAMERHLLAHGVAPGDIWRETAATNTLENMRLSAALIAEAIGWGAVRSVALCCKPLHSRRALLTARTVFPRDVALTVAVPQDPRDLQAATWWQTPEGIGRVMAELRRIGDYAAKGDIDLRAAIPER